MIQILEEMIRRFCAYRLEFKDSDGFTHDWCTLLPALELAYKTSIHSSTGKTPEILEKGWNPRLPYDTLKKELVDIHPTARSFKIILDKARHHANRCMQDYFTDPPLHSLHFTQTCLILRYLVIFHPFLKD
ncbi:hypothetical protein O181_057301 [Austropuccinia psidii MF-1]|uniref:Integrase catalytic domain-containing protein n=1 Tax=Austropuccinia psidii MF-1 TaxID=1389203 RepID=A0A9Q3HTT3_9BASI|nr:hypothetical protein [Austropuccinia psidii MF-1]